MARGDQSGAGVATSLLECDDFRSVAKWVVEKLEFDLQTRWDSSLKDDLVSEMQLGFWRVFQKRERFLADYGGFDKYIWTGLAWTVLALLRPKGSRIRPLLTVDEEVSKEMIDEHYDLEFFEIVEAIRTTSELMPPDRSRIVHLFLFDKLSVADIARHLNRPYQQVWRELKVGLETIRHAFC